MVDSKGSSWAVPWERTKGGKLDDKLGYRSVVPTAPSWEKTTAGYLAKQWARMKADRSVLIAVVGMVALTAVSTVVSKVVGRGHFAVALMVARTALERENIQRKSETIEVMGVMTMIWRGSIG